MAQAVTTVPWVATSTTQGWISPTKVNGIDQAIVFPYFIATSTTATSTGAHGINLTGGCFSINGSCITGGGGSTVPGGSDMNVQYNNMGSFGGDSNLTYDYNTGILNIEGGALIEAPVIVNATNIRFNGNFLSFLNMNNHLIQAVSTISDPSNKITLDVTQHQLDDSSAGLVADFSGANTFAINGAWTTTASSTGLNGINITSGCYAVSGVCLSSGGSGGVSSVTGTFPISSSGGTTPNITFVGLSTSTAAVLGNIPYFSGVNTFANVATSTLTASSPLTGSFTHIGTTGSLGCQAASGSQAGCLSSADWTTFNNKGSGSVTSVATNNGLTGGTITTTGTLGLNITGLSTNALVAWNGSNLVATGTQQLTVGFITATTTTATSTLPNLQVGTTTSNVMYVTNGVFSRKVGANQAMGTSTLSSGTVTVNNTMVKADSIIQLTDQTGGINLGSLSVGTKTAGTSFVINSTNALDSSTVLWEIIQPIY